MEAIVDAIKCLCYSRISIAIGIISGYQERIEEVVSWRDTINAMNVISVLMMMRIWDSHGERFYHTPSDKILRAEAKQAIDEELETFFSPIYHQTFWYVIFSSLFMSWKISDVLSAIFDWSLSLTTHQREYYMMTTAGGISPGHHWNWQRGFVRALYGLSCWSILLVLNCFVTC